MIDLMKARIVKKGVCLYAGCKEYSVVIEKATFGMEQVIMKIHLK